MPKLFCSCGSFTDVASGGARASGSARDDYFRPSGGATTGGVARDDVGGEVYDGLAACYPLDETGAGVTDEYKDRTRNAKHGTGKGMIPDAAPGVGCTASQLLNGDSWIETKPDNLKNNEPFAVSCWVKITSFATSRVFYSRGVSSTYQVPPLIIGHSYINHLWARLSTSSYYSIDVFSTMLLEQDRWYHVAVTWQPRGKLRLFVDGVLAGRVDAPISAYQSLQGGK
jgi:hypothetical protein